MAALIFNDFFLIPLYVVLHFSLFVRVIYTWL